jgi:hypothetical protein
VNSCDGTPERQQAMTPPRVVAGLIAAANSRQGGKVAAGGGTELVNDTGHHLADASAQGHAARRCRGGTAHANKLAAQRLDEPGGHAAAGLVIDFFDVE